MDSILESGYLYEFAGLMYYVFFLLMGRKSNAGKYSLRSRVLTLLAAIVLVGCVPLHYATSGAGIIGMFAIAIVAMASTLVDSIVAKREG